jgi:hypothetical protein
MTHPSEVEEVMRSARQEPNWKTAVIEGESWEGTTEENVAKYLRLLPPRRKLIKQQNVRKSQ